MDYDDYCKIIEILVNTYNISSYELNIIDDVLEYCNNYIGVDEYDENEVIRYILEQNYSPEPDDNFEKYCEVRDNLNLNEGD